MNKSENDLVFGELRPSRGDMSLAHAPAFVLATTIPS